MMIHYRPLNFISCCLLLLVKRAQSVATPRALFLLFLSKRKKKPGATALALIYDSARSLRRVRKEEKKRTKKHTHTRFYIYNIIYME